MIPFDFDYYKPETVHDAISLYEDLKTKGKKVLYYGGGTEFITMSRMNNIYADVVIDVKGIPELNICEIKENKLIIGAGVTLTKIAELDFFPLLSKTVKRIADHTVQDKITIGGNLVGSILYREAALPLLVSNSDIIVGNKDGIKEQRLMGYWNKSIKNKEDDLIMQFIVDTRYLHLPYEHVKRTKNEKIDYPLITIAALKDGDRINIGFSGLCDKAFRSLDIEDILNNSSISDKKRIHEIVQKVPYEIIEDIYGTCKYRKFMLSKMLEEIVDEFREDV